MKAEVKYPQIKVKLVGKDSNSFSILANVLGEMKRHKLSAEERRTFFDEAMKGDYNHLLQTCMKWVTIT